MPDSKVIEGPAGFCNFTPGDAGSLPTWHPPASGSLAQSKGGVSIEGPASKGYSQIPTTEGKEEA